MSSRTAESTLHVSVQPPRLLDQLRQAAVLHFGRSEPADRHVEWVRRFILFHGKRHPRELDVSAATKFLDHLVRSEKDPPRALESAHEALAFLYVQVLQLPREPFVLPQPPRLLDGIRHAPRVGHYSPRTEECYIEWATRFIRFHRMLHPNTVGVDSGDRQSSFDRHFFPTRFAAWSACSNRSEAAERLRPRIDQIRPRKSTNGPK
jgi:hypothetical protein